jgi:hypothetical protein
MSWLNLPPNFKGRCVGHTHWKNPNYLGRGNCPRDLRASFWIWYGGRWIDSPIWCQHG